MSELSPAAFAVVDAFVCAHARKSHPSSNADIAAVLRATADQVVPPALEEEYHDRNQALPLKKMVEIRQKLNAIADELEGAQ